MDYFKCERCGEVFDEFEMDFKYASEHGKCVCQKCLKDAFKQTNPPNKSFKPTIKNHGGQEDEMSVCDICGKQIWFSTGTIYYIDDEVKLLCPKCQANKALHSTRTSPGE